MRLDLTKMPPPDLVDTMGTKWWLDKSASDYASRPDRRGITLGAEVWLIEELDGRYAFTLVLNQRVIRETATIDDMAIAIDKIKATLQI